MAAVGRGDQGAPLPGQRCTATVNASWTASSATSMSPTTRTRTATARPYPSGRPARSPKGIPATCRCHPAGSVLQRPDLDREGDRPGELAAPLQGGVEIGCLDDGEPAQVLLALDVGPSVVSTSLPFSRTTVAVLDGCRPPANTQAPAARSSAFTPSTSRMIGSRNSADGTSSGVSPSGWASWVSGCSWTPGRCPYCSNASNGPG